MSTKSVKTNSNNDHVVMNWIMKDESDLENMYFFATEGAKLAYLQYGSAELAFDCYRHWYAGFVNEYQSLQYPYWVGLHITIPKNLKRFPNTSKGKKQLKAYFQETCFTETNCCPLEPIARALLDQGDERGAMQYMLDMEEEI